jgi:hypothetical protein
VVLEAGGSEGGDAVVLRPTGRRRRRLGDYDHEAAPGECSTPEAREALEVERREILARIEELESELRGLNVRLRALDRDLAQATAQAAVEPLSNSWTRDLT